MTRRASRFGLKQAQRRLTSTNAARYCWFSLGGDVQVWVGRQLTAHTTGIGRCGSPWSCPICAPIIREQRAQAVDKGVGGWLDAGHGALLLSGTLPHYQGQALAPRLNVISQALQRTLKGSGWDRRKDRLSYVGSIKATEITWGEANGWHPHFHNLLLTEQPLDAAETADLDDWLYGRWKGVCEAQGFGTPSRAHGLDLRQVWGSEGLSGYLTTVEGGWGIGRELARGDLKRGGDRLVPVDLLRNLVETGEQRWAALWVEYELATFGKNALVMGAGVRARLALEADKTDQELAAAEGADEALVMQSFGRDVWDGEARAGRLHHVLQLCEEEAARQIAEADEMGVDLPVLTLPKEGRS